MFKRLFFVILIGLLATGKLIAADAGVLEQINRAGEQRMLTQRIAKSFSQIGLNVQPLVAKQELDEAVKRFEANLSYLDTVVGAGDRPALASLRAVWTPYRALAVGLPGLAGAQTLSRRANEVLAVAESLVADLQKNAADATRPGGRLVAQAGRQRMLSQRIVKSYLLLSWGDTSETTREELDAAVNEFTGSLEAMRQRRSSDAVRRELDELAQHWEWLRAALAVEGATSYRLIVAEAAEAILQSADRLTALLAGERP